MSEWIEIEVKRRVEGARAMTDEEKTEHADARSRSNAGFDPTIHIWKMTGRCSNGAERDSGARYHAVLGSELKAICGAKPGKQSVGWSEYAGDTVTCPRCLKKMGSNV